MYLRVLLFVSSICLSTPYVTEPTSASSPEPSNETLQDDQSSLVETMTAMKDLVSDHRQVWEKQRAHQEQVRIQNRAEEEREAARSRALEAQQIILREKSRVFSRKLKLLTKKNKTTHNDQNGMALGMSASFNPVRDCSDIYQEGDETSGVYRVWPTRNENERGFSVYCDMDTEGAGWTVIHRRTADSYLSNYYNRSWYDYQHGFGDLESSFWLGNEQLHQLTNQGAYELRFDIKSGSQNTYSTYRSFFIEHEKAKYKLHISGYESQGTAGDIFTSSRGAKFSTYDKINLENVRVQTKEGFWGNKEYGYITHPNCAKRMKIGWWYPTNCIFHPMLHLNQTSPFKTEMKIRPVSFSQKDVA